MPWDRNQMAARAAKELEDGYCVILGNHLPSIHVKRLIFGTPCDNKIEFTTTREREAA